MSLSSLMPGTLEPTRASTSSSIYLGKSHRNFQVKMSLNRMVLSLNPGTGGGSSASASPTATSAASSSSKSTPTGAIVGGVVGGVVLLALIATFLVIRGRNRRAKREQANAQDEVGPADTSSGKKSSFGSAPEPNQP
jgi:hypothetical protein